jgi:hypothetical protein
VLTLATRIQIDEVIANAATSAALLSFALFMLVVMFAGIVAAWTSAAIAFELAIPFATTFVARNWLE